MPILRELGFEGYLLRQDFTGRSDDQPLYLGYAPPQVSASDAAWTIYKFTYDSSQRVTLREVAIKVSWDNRASSF